MKTFMFPGQGSQSKGMGGALFDEFKDLTKKADRILGYSIKELCLEDPRKELGNTQFTQPALYVVNALSYFKKLGESAQKPDFLAGHSLGEFNALLAAECFDFEVGLKLVQKRGELMGQISGGGMAAIVNASKEEIESILGKNGLTHIDLANYNTPSQIVISGLLDEIRTAQALFQEGRMLYYPLNTSGAFHSRFMLAAKEKFQTYLKKFKFSDLKIPVISNVTARPYENDQVLENLSKQIASTVRWSESIQYLLSSSADPMQFEEVGHGDVLTKLVHAIRKQSPNTAKASLLQEAGPDKKTSTSPVAEVAKAPAVEQKTIIDPIAQLDAAPQKHIDAAEKVLSWNQQFPVGTKVKSLTLDYESLETRTEAMVLFGHRAAVYMKGYNGYFDLDEITGCGALAD